MAGKWQELPEETYQGAEMVLVILKARKVADVTWEEAVQVWMLLNEAGQKHVRTTYENMLTKGKESIYDC